jgi:hypothetical protein
MFGTELTLDLVYDGVSTNYAQLVVFLASAFTMATTRALQLGILYYLNFVL